MKKLIILIKFILLIFIFYLTITLTSKNYEINYTLDNINITEKYDKNDKVYYFTFETNEEKYVYATYNKYINERKLINKINQDQNCLEAKSNYLLTFSICKDKENYISKNYNQEISTKKTDSYNNINIYDLDDKKYYIWNYTAFYSISNSKKSEIKLFSKDIYILDAILKFDHYLLVADYNEKYTFQKLYLINSTSDSYKEVKLDRKLYFDGYFLGNYKKNVYYYDIVKNQMYKINPFKEKIEKSANNYLLNGKFTSTSTLALNNKEIYFTEEKLFGYKLENNQLYFYTPVNQVLVTNLNVSSIVESSEEDCYFISGDTLYYINIEGKITKIMSYSEWQFNNKNIYIFE